MPRLQPVRRESAEGATAEVLDTIRQKMGGVPNILATMANSPAVAKAYLSFSGALSEGSLSARLREEIALAVGEKNNCGYCVAAHTALGKKAGLTDEEAQDARRGQSRDAKEQAAVTFARKLVDERGWVSDEDVASLKSAGFSDGEVAEIVAAVALNIFTNYFNHVAGTEVDFPQVPQVAA